MAAGRVKWFNDARGFGLIESADGRIIFVHYTQILNSGFKTLEAGQWVEFDLYEEEARFHAKNVQVSP